MRCVRYACSTDKRGETTHKEREGRPMVTVPKCLPSSHRQPCTSPLSLSLCPTVGQMHADARIMPRNTMQNSCKQMSQNWALPKISALLKNKPRLRSGMCIYDRAGNNTFHHMHYKHWYYNVFHHMHSYRCKMYSSPMPQTCSNMFNVVK